MPARRFPSEDAMQQWVERVLAADGWMVQREVMFYFAGRVDLVAYLRDEDRYVAVETKLSATANLLHQAARHTMWASESWAVVPTARQARYLVRVSDSLDSPMQKVGVAWCDVDAGQLVFEREAIRIEADEMLRYLRDKMRRWFERMYEWQHSEHPTCWHTNCLLRYRGRCLLPKPVITAKAQDGLGCESALTEQMLRSLAALPITKWHGPRVEALLFLLEQGPPETARRALEVLEASPMKYVTTLRPSGLQSRLAKAKAIATKRIEEASIDGD